jgi:tetratricopeptide (TPR) repeat protein
MIVPKLDPVFATILLAIVLSLANPVAVADAIEGRCVDAPGMPCGSGGGATGGHGPSIWERMRERRELKEREDRKKEQRYRDVVDGWSQITEEYKQQNRIQQERDARVQRNNLLRARQTADIMNAWNDVGFEAYHAGDWGNAITYFKAAQRNAPDSSEIRYNLQRAEGRLSAKAESYLSSLDTALDITKLSPYLMVFHPNPHVRAEANRQLVRDTLNLIAEEAATFIAMERLNAGTITPFPWETKAEQMARRSEARRHAEKVESLWHEALAEARRQADEMIVADLKEDIRIQPKPAMAQLLKISVSGFQE